MSIPLTTASVSREWLRAVTVGPTPVGRYGHAVTMVGHKLYVFGGQHDGNFFNDMWAFDLNSSEPTFQYLQYLLIYTESSRLWCSWIDGTNG